MADMVPYINTTWQEELYLGMQPVGVYASTGFPWNHVVENAGPEGRLLVMSHGGSSAHLQLSYKRSICIDTCRMGSFQPPGRGRDLEHEWTTGIEPNADTPNCVCLGRSTSGR